MRDDIKLIKTVCPIRTTSYVLFDLATRIVFIILGINGLVDSNLVILINTLLLPISWLVLYFVARWIVRRQIPNDYEVDFSTIQVSNRTAKIFILIVAIGTLLTFIHHSLYTDYDQSNISTIFAVTFTLFYFIYTILLFKFSISISNKKILVQSKDGDYLVTRMSELFRAQYLGKEADDQLREKIKIENFKQEVNNHINFLSNLTNEAIFTGALVFSGFISIITSDKYNDQPNLFKDSLTFLDENLYELPLNFILILTTLVGSDVLFGFLAIMSLVCSSLFVIVLIFKNILFGLVSSAQKIINLDLLNSDIVEYNKIQKTTLNGLVETMDSIYIIRGFLNLFRVLGFLSLVTIIVSSGLFFSLNVFYILLFLFLSGVGLFLSIYIVVSWMRFKTNKTFEF